MAKFTVESLQMWQFAPNSIHYLLSLWQRMIASVPYVKVQAQGLYGHNGGIDRQGVTGTI